jgi:hypothetical protein
MAVLASAMTVPQLLVADSLASRSGYRSISQMPVAARAATSAAARGCGRGGALAVAMTGAGAASASHRPSASPMVRPMPSKKDR